MYKYQLKTKYPLLDFDESFDVWQEEHEFTCKTHGKQTVGVDHAMVVKDQSCCSQQLEEAYCPICLREERGRSRAEEIRVQRENDQKLLLKKQRNDRTYKMAKPSRFLDATFDNFIATTPKQKASLKACKTFAEKFTTLSKQKGGLIMVGNVGTGKTHLAIAIGQALLAKDLTVKYLTIGRLIRAVRDTWGSKEQSEEDIYYNLSRNYELLIIDEIGVQNCSENEKSILFEVINARYEEQKPTILISNLDVTEIEHVVGQRVFDRISEGGGNRIVFDWDSYRMKNAA